MCENTVSVHGVPGKARAWVRNRPVTGYTDAISVPSRATRTTRAPWSRSLSTLMRRGERARRLYCRVWSNALRVFSSSGRSAVNFQSGTEPRITTPFSSVTMTGASTVDHDCSSWSRLTLVTATPTVRLPSSSADAR